MNKTLLGFPVVETKDLPQGEIFFGNLSSYVAPIPLSEYRKGDSVTLRIDGTVREYVVDNNPQTDDKVVLSPKVGK